MGVGGRESILGSSWIRTPGMEGTSSPVSWLVPSLSLSPRTDAGTAQSDLLTFSTAAVS